MLNQEYWKIATCRHQRLKSYRSIANVVLVFLILLFTLLNSTSLYGQHNASQQDSLKAKHLKDTSFELIRTNPDSAIVVARKLADYGELKNNLKWEVDGLRRIGMAYEAKAKFDSALVYYNRSLKLRESSGDIKLQAVGIGDLAILAITTGRYQESIELYKRQLSLWKELGDSTRISKAYNNVGVAYFYLGDVRNTIDAYSASMKIDAQLGNTNRLQRTKVNVAQLYNRIGNHQKAIELLSEAEDYFKENDSDFVNDYTIRSTQGAVYSDMEEFIKAMEKYQLAFAIAEESKNPLHKARAFMNIGLVHKRTGEFQEAIEKFEKALSYHKEFNDPQGIAITLANLGKAYLETGKIREAIAVSKRVIGYHDEYGNLVEAVEAYDVLAQCYKQLGDAPKAYSALEKHLRLRDSLDGDEKVALLLDKEYEFKYELKAKSDSLQLAYENEFQLNDQKKQHKRQTERLLIGGVVSLIFLIVLGLLVRARQKRKLLKAEFKAKTHELNSVKSEMKALRSQMNPHFIFNALQSIQNFLLDHKSEEANEHLLKFSKLMRNVLENSRHDEVLIEEDLDALELYIELEKLRFPRPFNHTITIDNSVIPDEDMIPPLILQPFVENAIWHGLKLKKDNGAIDISISKNGNFLHCIVEDNGVGRQKAASKVKTDTLKKASLGLQITKERLSLHDSRFNLSSSLKVIDLKDDNEQPRGTRVELTIPIST